MKLNNIKSINALSQIRFNYLKELNALKSSKNTREMLLLRSFWLDMIRCLVLHNEILQRKLLRENYGNQSNFDN